MPWNLFKKKKKDNAPSSGRETQSSSNALANPSSIDTDPSPAGPPRTIDGSLPEASAALFGFLGLSRMPFFENIQDIEAAYDINKDTMRMKYEKTGKIVPVCLTRKSDKANYVNLTPERDNNEGSTTVWVLSTKERGGYINPDMNWQTMATKIEISGPGKVFVVWSDIYGLIKTQACFEFQYDLEILVGNRGSG